MRSSRCGAVERCGGSQLKTVGLGRPPRAPGRGLRARLAVAVSPTFCARAVRSVAARPAV
jgi:hypothetical protein